MRPNHPFCRPVACFASALASLLIPCCTSALAQNLYTQPATYPAIKPIPPAPAPGDSATTPTAPQTPNSGTNGSSAVAPETSTDSASDALSGVSLFAVKTPPPHKYAKHEVVEVIINESSVQSFNQTTDLKKDYTNKNELSKFPSLQSLFSQLALREGIGSVHPGVGVSSNKELKGMGQLDRKDQVTAKISAFVIDVKPNGNLVLEARESITADKEISTMVLSGTCRAEDLTRNNTIQSSQIAGLTIRIEHDGAVRESGEKGLLSRVLETIFNF